MKKYAKLALLMVGSFLVVGMSFAQQWPNRPVRLVVPFAPGGNVDVAARIVSVRLSEQLGQPIIIENKGGAGGLIAADYVAKETADGYTFVIAGNGLLFLPVMAGRADYDWQRQFIAVGPVSFSPQLLLVQSSLAANNVADFIALAKRSDFNMGSGGAGSTTHLISELLQSQTGARWTTVHYKGNAPANTALLAGEVQFTFNALTVALPLLNTGKVKALAITSSTRFSLLPNVPTMEESGFKELEVTPWLGIFAPAGTPASIITRLNTALSTVLQEPAMVKRFTDLGAEPRPMDPNAFQAYVRRENEKWLPVIRASNIKAD